jgi:pyruvate dehydrogenase phosphatase
MKDAFVVMGTDGLWEKLTNEEVVGLVGKWLDKRNGNDRPSGWFTARSGNSFDVESDEKNIEGTKKPGKRSAKFVWQDGNAATHLIRNALGGGDLDEVSPARVKLT